MKYEILIIRASVRIDKIFLYNWEKNCRSFDVYYDYMYDDLNVQER